MQPKENRKTYPLHRSCISLIGAAAHSVVNSVLSTRNQKSEMQKWRTFPAVPAGPLEAGEPPGLPGGPFVKAEAQCIQGVLTCKP